MTVAMLLYNTLEIYKRRLSEIWDVRGDGDLKFWLSLKIINLLFSHSE
jgi:hypothetical protein